jgi:hypothetical protein
VKALYRKEGLVLTEAQLTALEKAKTAADLLNDRVIPFFERYEVKLLRVLTDRGSEYCGNPEGREYAHSANPRAASSGYGTRCAERCQRQCHFQAGAISANEFPRQRLARLNNPSRPYVRPSQSSAVHGTRARNLVINFDHPKSPIAAFVAYPLSIVLRVERIAERDILTRRP